MGHSRPVTGLIHLYCSYFPTATAVADIRLGPFAAIIVTNLAFCFRWAYPFVINAFYELTVNSIGTYNFVRQNI